MLKLSIKNPTTQETETYDVATEFNQFFNQAKEYAICWTAMQIPPPRLQRPLKAI